MSSKDTEFEPKEEDGGNFMSTRSQLNLRQEMPIPRVTCSLPEKLRNKTDKRSRNLPIEDTSSVVAAATGTGADNATQQEKKPDDSLTKTLPEIPLNRRTFDDLGKSLRQIGQLNEIIVCKQHPVVILVGRHRAASLRQSKKAMRKRSVDVEELAAKKGVPHHVMETLVTINGNVQRVVRKKETLIHVGYVARELEQGGYPKDKIAKALASLLPYSHSYILRLLPQEYKQEKFAVSPGRPRRGKIVFLGKRHDDGGAEITGSKVPTVNIEDNKEEEKSALRTEDSITKIDSSLKKMCYGCRSENTLRNVDLCARCLQKI